MDQRKSKSSRVEKSLVGIVMGSTSDLSVMAEAAEILKALGVASEVTIVSAHRTPEWMFEYATSATKRGLKVVIAGAGGAAHLPGMIASLTVLPVIGVPILSKNSLQGLDSLLSIVQMPGGIPVATVAVNGAKNAGILAAQIIGLSDKNVHEQVAKHRLSMKKDVEKNIKSIQDEGYEHVLKNKSK